MPLKNLRAGNGASTLVAQLHWLRLSGSTWPQIQTYLADTIVSVSVFLCVAGWTHATLVRIG